MKKIFIVGALIFGAFVAQAQQAVVFKIKYLPNKVYNMTTKIDMAMDLNMTEGVAKKAKRSKAPAPQAFKQNAASTMQAVVKTGAPKADHTFPLTMQFTKFSTNAKINGKDMSSNTNPLLGQVIYGECDADGKMHIDTIKGGNAGDVMKKAMTDMVNKMQAQVKFPEKPLKVGESFTQNTPLNMPMAGANIDMNAKYTYKLTAIKGNLAYFDMKITMAFGVDMKQKGAKATGTGSGKGAFVYNIDENNCTAMTSITDLKYNMDMGGKKMATIMHMKSDMQTQISRL